MKKQWWIIGGSVVAFCCLSSMCLAFASSDAGFNSAAKSLAEGQRDDSLVGEWSSTSTSLTSYRNTATGSWAPPSGSALSVELHADGSCVQMGLIQQSFYGCTSYMFAYYEECSWSVDGSTVTLTLGEGSTITKPCGREEIKGTVQAQQPHVFKYVKDDVGLMLDDGSFRARRVKK